METKRKKIVYKKIDDIKPYAKNPRKNDEAVEFVMNSIDEFHFQNPILIDKNNVIVAGHTRHKAAKQLGIEELPCIVVDDLTDKQIKAFRIVDNKVAEKAEWDYSLLDEEFELLPEYEFEDFGFEFNYEEDEEQNKVATQERVENILNLAQASYEGVGDYDIPELYPISVEEIGEINEWIGFNYVLSDEEPEGKAVHFFVDDYQFERLWNNPEKYVEKLSKYACVLTPDFSPYADMPMATQIFNHYRKHWVGKYLQERGVKIVPTIRASRDERSLKWYLDGEPKGGVVCISSMWAKDGEAREYFLREYGMMKDRLKPEKIFVYGNEVDGIDDVEYIQAFTRKRFGR